MSKRNEQGLLYNDDAHRDAWSGLTHMGVWDFKITEDMVGKTFGSVIGALVTAEGVPTQKSAAPRMSLEELGYTDLQLGKIRDKMSSPTSITYQIKPGRTCR